MNDTTIDENIESIRTLFHATQQVLNECFQSRPDGEKIQVPVLLGMMAVKLGWDEKKVRDYDPFVRFHVRNHPDWYVSRGAKGGVMGSSEKQKKDAALQAKEQAKQEMAELLAAKLAGQG